MGPAMFQ